MKIGLDFGTCFSQPAIMSGNIPMADNIGGKEGIPSTFAFDGKRNLFGTETIGCKSNVIRYMKRTVRESPDGIDLKVNSGGKEFTVGEVIELYIGYLLDEVKRIAKTQDYVKNEKFETVTVTAPLGIELGSMMASDYYDFIRGLVMKKTGLDEEHVFILGEPEAAALYFLETNGKKNNDSDDTVLVFDLGGGTLDINIMRRRKNTYQFETLVNKGDLYLGGNDWDEKLKDVVISKEPRCRDLAEKKDLQFETELIDLKLKLSLREAGAMTVCIDDDDFSITVKREEFERASKGLCDRAMNLLKEAIRSYEAAHSEPIDNIVLVGGASAMPQIRDGVVAAVPGKYKDKIIYDPVQANPSKSIAKGAAIFSNIAHEKIGEGDVTETPVLKHTAKQTYGFRSCNREFNKFMLYNVIFINSPHTGANGDGDIVVRASSSFSPIDKDQRSVGFVCYETVVEKKDCLRGAWSELNEKAKPNGKKVSAPVPKEYYENNRSDEYSVIPEFHLDIDGVIDIVLYDMQGKMVATTKKGKGA